MSVNENFNAIICIMDTKLVIFNPSTERAIYESCIFTGMHYIHSSENSHAVVCAPAAVEAHKVRVITKINWSLHLIGSIIIRMWFVFFLFSIKL